ncbi:MAG: DUF4421 domain-containing protein [Cyclobacteriaceae bacterium]|nr:DUF4421 domain-containing protein [Cyclobacteriaceae bacterium]
MHRFAFYCLFLTFHVNIVAAEKPVAEDTIYFITYADQLSSRLYFSRKFSSLAINRFSELNNIKFQPNTTTNFGVGATYQNFTLNLAYGFGFINPDVGKGKTQYLDLQIHFFPKKFAIDLFGQFYNGFYQKNPDYNQGNRYELRPDLHLRKFGMSFQYVFNHRRFSYRAPVFHSEWQKKSAGSFLLGFESFTGYFRADSTLHRHNESENSSYTRFFNIGPSAGYGHTLVIKRHFYISATIALAPGYALSKYIDRPDIPNNHGININASYRLFAGYNSEKWAVGFFYVDHLIFFPGASTPFQYSLNTGNLRFNLVKRFSPGPNLKKFLRPVDKILTSGER